MVGKAARHPPMHRVPLAELRAAMPRQLSSGLPREAVGEVEDRDIAGPRGPIGLRVYRPAVPGGGEGDEPRPPLTLFFHGSGFTICSLDTHDAICRQICNRSGTLVVSVDYRLAPENPFPAGPEDCWAATVWAAGHAEALGARPGPLAVCGDSAGGTMAALVALRARDAGGPAIGAQLLLYPVTDHYAAGHPSFDERGAGCGMTREDMRWFWDQYLPDPSLAGRADVSPARAPDLSGLPPTYVAIAEYDVLRDEGELFARRLGEAGVPVTLRRYPTMNHGFLHWVGVVEAAGDAMNDLGGWLRNTFTAGER